jgi:hypothetical protein
MNEFRGEFEVEIAGKKYQGKLSMNALRLLCKYENIDLDSLHEYLTKDPMTGVCTLTYHAIKNKALLSGTDSNLPTLEVFMAQALDEPKVFAQMSQTVMENLAPNSEDDESKKA